MEHGDCGTLSRQTEVITMYIIQQVPVKIGTQRWRSGIDDIMSLIQKVNLKRPSQIHLMCIIYHNLSSRLRVHRLKYEQYLKMDPSMAKKNNIFMKFQQKTMCEVFPLAFQISALMFFWVGFWGPNWKPRDTFFPHVSNSQIAPASLASTLASWSHIDLPTGPGPCDQQKIT